MSGIAEALALGGYGAYVWPAYGFAAIVLIGLFVAARRRLERAERDAEQMRAVLRGPEARS
ncbi:MAG TPA: heme exporter protein CcmD [Alphaproteobacteria bacterium]|nr:heme exporter protein CcmD [Alphaproteobacteria bacterium]